MKHRLTAASVLAAAASAAVHAQSSPTVTLQLVSPDYSNPNYAISVNEPRISADGSTVVYSTTSSGLVAPGQDGFFGADVFAYNVNCSRAEVISKTWKGLPANNSSGGSVDKHVTVSGDGRFVAFVSIATNLVGTGPVDTANTADVFVVDRQQRFGSNLRVRRVSLGWNGEAPNGQSYYPSISADGNYVAFLSAATNLTADFDENGSNMDVYVYSMSTKTIERRTHAADDGGTVSGMEAPEITADGSRVLFSTISTDLVEPPTNFWSGPHVYTEGPNGNTIVDVNTLEAIAESSATSTHSIAGNGSAAAFASKASNLWLGVPSMLPTNPGYVFVRKFGAGDTYLISLNTGSGPGDIASDSPSMNADGNYVAFRSFSNGIAEDGSVGIFRRDVDGGTALLLSRGLNGQPENQSSSLPSINGDGSRVAFTSTSSNLIPNQTGSGGAFVAHIGTSYSCPDN